VKQFQKTLEKEIQLPIILHDERLTTSEARFGLSDIEDGDIDAEAARLILEDYLKTRS
jgi:RNase H-fold protein (predicted Holliday junction resolvase)